MAGPTDPDLAPPLLAAVAATLRRVARRAIADRADLLALSRPGAWAWTALPFLIGALDGGRGLSTALVIGTLYLLLPFDLLVRGVATVGAKVDDDAAMAVWFAIALTNLPFLVILTAIGGPSAAMALAAMVALALARGLAPVRMRWRPVLEVAADAVLPALAALAGLLSVGAPRDDLPWPALAALVAWAAAIRAIGAAPSLAPAIGRRAPGIVGLVGVGAAVALAVATGPLGVLAAIGLATYLLPAVMTVTSSSSGPGRAARELPALHLLVGGWLGLLLLRHWDILIVGAWEVAILAPTIAAGYVLANIVAIRIATRRRRVRADSTETPSLAVIVPVRDAILSLPASLAALRSQTYADATILVVDDASTDASADEAAAWLGADAVIPAPPRPDGWTSGAWACHVGAGATDADLLMFVDPSVVLGPIATRLLVEQLQAGAADLLSGAPKPVMRTSAERAAAPAAPLAVFGFVPVWWSAITGGRPAASAFAHGSIVLVRRTAYVAGGGHAAAPASPHPARSLAAAVARAGGRVGTVHAARLGASRRLRTVEAAADELRHGFLPAVGGTLAAGLAAMLVEALAFVAPVLVLPLAVLTGAGQDLVAAAAVPLALLLSARLALALTQHHPLASIAWHPVTVGILMAAQAAAIADRVLGLGSAADPSADEAPPTDGGRG